MAQYHQFTTLANCFC